MRLGFIPPGSASPWPATLVIAGEALARAPRQHGAMAPSKLSGTARQMLPFGAAGAVVTLVICLLAPDAAGCCRGSGRSWWRS